MNDRLHPTKKEFQKLIMYSEYLNKYQKYISGEIKTMPEKGEKIIKLELHLLNCTTCLEMLKDIGYLKNNFDTVWEQEFPSFQNSPVEEPVVQPFLMKLLSWINNSLKIAQERESDKLITLLRGLEAQINSSLSDIQMAFNPNPPKLKMVTLTAISATNSVSDYEHKLRNITFYWDKIPFKKDNITLENGKLTFQYYGSIGFTNATLINPVIREDILNNLESVSDILNNAKIGLIYEINGWCTIEFNNVKDELTQTEKEKIKEIEYYLYLYN